MALKNWKQTTENTWKNKADYQYLTIIKMNRLKKLPLYFVIISDYKKENVRKFVTKTQALKYAKDYMKKH